MGYCFGIQRLGACNFQTISYRHEKRKREEVEYVRVDNGGGYRGPFEYYCKDYGIKFEKTVLKTPQHNGVAKRINWTINDRIRYMLSQARLLKSFRGEAMTTIVDLINLSP